MRPAHRFLVLTIALLLTATACGDDPAADVDEEEGPAPTPTEEPAEDPTPEPDDTPEPAEPEEPVEEDDDVTGDDGEVGEGDTQRLGDDFGTDEVASDDFPSLDGDVALLGDVRVGAHDGFERVVLEFAEGEEPSYRVTYTDPPITESGSGEEVDVTGSAFLEIILEPASRVDLMGEEAREVYDGPDRVEGTGGAVTEVVLFGDFESNMGWVIGLDERRPFAVSWLSDPLRLVVEVESG